MIQEPKIVFRILNNETNAVEGSYSRACHMEYDFQSVASARNANCHDLFQDKKKYRIAKYKVTYELLENSCD